MRGHRMTRLLFVVPAILCMYGFNNLLQEEEENDYTPDMENLRRNMYASNATYQVLPPVQVLDISMFRLWKKLLENGSSLDILFRSAKKYQIKETAGVLIPCHNCWPETTKPCTVPGMLWWIIDKQVPAVYPNRAVHTVPRGFAVQTSDIQGAGKGVFTLQDIPPCTIIGPHWGQLLSFQELKFVNQHDYVWELSNDTYRDAYNETISNWLRYINCPNYEYEQNVVPEEYDGEIYYRTVDQIPAGKELLAWYGDSYGKRLRQMHVTKNVIFKPRSQK